MAAPTPPPVLQPGGGCYCISMTVIWFILLVASTYVGVKNIKRALWKEGRARVLLLICILAQSIGLTLRFFLLIFNVGEADVGSRTFLILLQNLSGLVLVSSLSLIVYVWIKTYYVVLGKRWDTFGKIPRRVCLTFNVVMWVSLVTIDIVTRSIAGTPGTENTVSSLNLAFNLVVGISLLGIVTLYLFYGPMLQKQAKASQLMTEANKKAMSKVTWLVGTVSFIGIMYIIAIVIFVSLPSRTLTSMIVTRYTIFRLLEWFTNWILLITFGLTNQDSVRQRAQSRMSAVDGSGRPSV